MQKQNLQMGVLHFAVALGYDFAQGAEKLEHFYFLSYSKISPPIVEQRKYK